MSGNQPITTLRCLLKELRLLHLSGTLQRKPSYRYILDQFRKFKVTNEKNCRARNEAHHNAHTYNCLLRSTRELEVLHATFYRGERSIEESAKLVGLKLPEAPKPV
ncbi:protein FMC1 homolog [Antedon mediterranea]|uniref:protein FMC1 homolog n=1 Tax=Antedon mediterranea TaxID=105859 RepID=UPI003AF6B082